MIHPLGNWVCELLLNGQDFARLLESLIADGEATTNPELLQVWRLEKKQRATKLKEFMRIPQRC